MISELLSHGLLLMATITATLSLAIIQILLSSGLGWRIVDQPNHRSLHSRPIPRIGGLVILPVSMLVLAMSPMLGGHTQDWPLLAALLALYLVSLLDDIRGLSAASRLLAQLAAALLWISFDLASWPLWLQAGAVLLTVAMANFFNFMDGANGLAGGMALFGFAGLAWVAPPTLLPYCLVMAAAAAAFLCFNFDPAKIFLGDAGSIPLGFLAAALGLLGWQQQAWPLATPLLAFLPFWGDALVTLIRRGLRGEKVWQAHREHYYQRLIQLGWGHRRTALSYYLLMLCCAASAVVAASWPALGWALLFIFMALAALLMRQVDQLWLAHTLQCRHA